MVPSKREQLEPRKMKTKFCSKQSNLSLFFKSPSSKDAVEAKSSLSSSLTLCDVEDDSNLILMVTLDQWFLKYGSRRLKKWVA